LKTVTKKWFQKFQKFLKTVTKKWFQKFQKSVPKVPKVPKVWAIFMTAGKCGKRENAVFIRM